MFKAYLGPFVCAFLGIVCLCAAYFDWDGWFQSARVEDIVGLLGRNGARIFYAILGVLFILTGVWVLVTCT